MRGWRWEVDRVLRSDATGPAALRRGLAFLLQTRHRRSVARAASDGPPTEADELVGDEKSEGPGALEREPEQVLGRHVRTVFNIWVVVFGLVGAQMSWVLSPFL